MTEEKKLEFTQRIGKANKTEMVVVVYDIALAYSDEALKDLEAGRTEDFQGGLKSLRKCIDDLVNALNFDIPLSYNLLSVYQYMNRKLMESRIYAKADGLLEVRKMLATLRDSFAEIAKQDHGPALSETTEHVVAGMTYGRGSLNENIVNSSAGFTV